MAVSRMRFTFSANGTYYIDLANALSIQERRLHRQKQIYTVLGGYMKDQDGSTAHFNTAPMTWPVKRSINRGFRHWKKMISNTLSNTDGVTTGKWNDFKVRLDSTHSSNKLPVDAAGQTINSGDWDYSTLTSADPSETGHGITLDPDQFSLMIVGPHSGSSQTETNPYGWSRISLIQSWVDSRALPTSNSGDPVHASAADVSADPLSNLFDVGDVDDDRLDIINLEGDLPPYDLDDMFGNCASGSGSNNLQRMSSCQTSAANPIAMVMGFQALCGLVQVVITNLGSNDSSELVLDVDTQGVKF